MGFIGGLYLKLISLLCLDEILNVFAKIASQN